VDEKDMRIIRAIQKIHRHPCRVWSYRIALFADVPIDDVTDWLHKHGLWFHRYGVRKWGEWMIEHPKAFEPVRAELGEIFREAAFTW
jgi:hypothetical protein